MSDAVATIDLGSGLRRPRIAVCTSIAANYLAHARVLAKSLSHFHPNLRLIVALIDEPGEGFDPAQEPFDLIEAGELSLASFNRMRFAWGRRHLSALAKPYLPELILDREFDAVVHLDADTYAFGPIDSVLDAAATATVALIPHFLSVPRDGSDREPELRILRSGVFNGGVVAVSNSSEGRDFLRWWRERSWAMPPQGSEIGTHFDQRWLDLAATFFDGVRVIRDPGVDVAHWNLGERAIRERDGVLTAGGVPLNLFHFSGFDPHAPEQATIHFERPSASEFGSDAARLFDDYARRLLREGYDECASWPYAYGVFSNGAPIPSVARLIYRELGDDGMRFGDPFDTGGRESFAAWLNEPADLSGGSEAVGYGGGPGRRNRPGWRGRSRREDGSRCPTRLWERIYRLRPDVQAAFPDVFGADASRFIEWTRTNGAQEHEIPEMFILESPSNR